MRSKWIWAALTLVAVLGITTAASATTRGLITGRMIAPHSINSKHLVNHSIQAHDLSNGLIASLHGAKGDTGPAGPAGTALAYAHVLYNSGTASFDAAQTHGMGSATVTAVGMGGFCFANLPFTPHNATASIDWPNGTETDIAQVALAPGGTAFGCPAGNQLRVEVIDAKTGTEEHAPFYITIN